MDRKLIIAKVQAKLASVDRDVQTAVDACEGNNLASCGPNLEKVFGKKNVSSLGGGMIGFRIQLKGGKKLAVTSAANADDADAYTKDKKIAVGFF